jgi:hypothetical protein
MKKPLINFILPVITTVASIRKQQEKDTVNKQAS